MDLAEASFLPVGKQEEKLPLAVREIVKHPLRGDVAAGQEPHDYLSRPLLELRLGVSRLLAEPHDLLRAASPLL